MKRFGVLTLLSLLALFTLSVPAFADTGTLQGQVENGTPGADIPAGLTVTLTTYVNDVDKGTRDATTDADGKFSFSGLDTAPSNSYEVKTNYKTVDYVSKPVTFGTGETSKPVVLTIYETTDSPDKIKAHLTQFEFYFEQGQLMFADYNVFTNSDNLTYVGSRVVRDDGAKETLKFPIPPDAKLDTIDYPGWEGQQFMVCCAVLTDGDLLVDTMPVMPGSKVLAVTYELKYTAPNYALTRVMEYPAEIVNVLIFGDGIQATSDKLVSQGRQTDQGTSYLLLSGQSMKAGDTINVSLSNLPEVGKDPQAAQNAWKWALMGLGVVGVAAAVGYPLYRRRQPVLPRPAASSAALREHLLQEIADLDDDFDAGSIPEEQYRQERARKKAQLARLAERPGQQR